MSTPADLAGRGVLVTRPAGQAEPLCRLIEAAGGRAIRFPTIAIEPTHDPEATALLGESWDLLYFVSPNAVEQALALVADAGWLRVERVAAVGRGTARALEAAGRAPELVPHVRYESGRALFAQAMTERGAEVCFAEVYRRVRPAVEVAPLLARWSEEVDFVMATSDEVLLNLAELLGQEGRARLLATPLVVIAERTAQTARDLGFQTIRVAERADDESIVRALIALS